MPIIRKDQQNDQSQPGTPQTGARKHTGQTKSPQPVIIQISKSSNASGLVARKDGNIAHQIQSDTNVLNDYSKSTIELDEIINKDKTSQQIEEKDVGTESQNVFAADPQNEKDSKNGTTA
jgi:hypothetical protein